MVIKLVPFENKQSSQIVIPEELAMSLVASLVPASFLTALLAPMLASKSIYIIRGRIFNGGVTLSQYQKDEHLRHCLRKAAFLPHPWHVLIPSSFVENRWTSLFNASNSCSDSGKICVTSGSIN
jgi:hypothetical protein